MKSIALAASALLFWCGVLMAQTEAQSMSKNIKWLGHASFVINADGKRIYIDPFEIQLERPRRGTKEPADIILITHEHFDHCSPDDVRKIQGPNTTIVATKDSAKKLKGNVKVVQPNEKIALGDIEIETVPAYNLNKQFHPKANGWVGYVVNVKGTKIYHTGDSDYIPEMNSLKIDIALVPVGGTYTMDAEEAANFVNTVKPKIAIPMHWGSIVGSRSDAERFKGLCRTQVEILEKEQ